MAELPQDFVTALRDVYVQEDGSEAAFETEREIVLPAIRAILDALGPKYSLVRPLGRGGAGVVLEVYDNDLRIQRALKLPRPRQGELLESVKNETDHLRALHHDYLIRVYAAGEVEAPGYSGECPYFLMDFVEGKKDLDEYLIDRLRKMPNVRDIPRHTDWLAATLSKAADALAFLHENHTLHFDVKPANILIDINGKPLLSDLGFAKEKTDDKKPIVVGFTLFYAHPELRQAYEHMSSQNRVRRWKAPADFMYSWDLYALGRTILQLLSLVDQAFPDAVMYDYTFLYLHLMACRMLDGRNLTKAESDRIRQEHVRRGEPLSVYLEHWLVLESGDFADLRYASASGIVKDFRKLREPEYFLAHLPELSPHYPHRVQVSDGTPAPFSPRVKRVVEHPTFLRLRSVKQLGITDSVYPGCSHSRLEHSLGAFRTCWLYLQTLENDPYNPLFRQLTDEKDLSALLLASLLHDIGQYPLAHELEDGALAASLTGGRSWKEILRHETLSVQWLGNPTRDSEGRTIKDIIEDAEYGWNTPLHAVAQLIDDNPPGNRPLLTQNLKTGLLQSLINGPLDVDKLDYLVRDSKRAHLPYGQMIDTDRLARSLTVVLTKDEEKHTLLTLGVYEKGQSAAEAVTFVRYELYQALYWHHTVRAIRPMLREVLRQVPKDKRKGRSSAEDAFLAFLGVAGAPAHITVESVLEWLRQFTSAVGKELLDLIVSRHLYKRLLTIHSEPDEGGGQDLLQRFRTAQHRADFDDLLQKEICERFDQYITGIEGPRPSALAADKLGVTQEELLKPGRILCDCPMPRTGSKERLRLALEPKRRLQNYASRVEIAERVSEVWQQVNYRLMAIASKGRVYCHPSIRDALMSALGPLGVRQALERVVDKSTT